MVSIFSQLEASSTAKMATVESEESTPVGAQHGRRSGGASPGPAPAPTANRTGWGMSEGKSDSSTAASQSSRNRVLAETDDNEIQEIPDTLDDDEEDLSGVVANAPRNAARKVQSMAELDHSINFAEAAAAAMRSGAYGKTVDLSLLTSALIPQSKLDEADEEWQFTALLQECAQAHQKDSDRLEAGADKLVLTDAAAATAAAADQTFAGDASGMTTRGGGIQGTLRQRGPMTGASAASSGSGGHK